MIIYQTYKYDVGLSRERRFGRFNCWFIYKNKVFISFFVIFEGKMAAILDSFCIIINKIADDRRPHPLFLLIIEASVRGARAFFDGPAVCAWHPVSEDRRTLLLCLCIV